MFLLYVVGSKLSLGDACIFFYNAQGSKMGPGGYGCLKSGDWEVGGGGCKLGLKDPIK